MDSKVSKRPTLCHLVTFSDFNIYFQLNVGDSIIYSHFSINYMAVVSPHTLNDSELLLWNKLVQLGANENTASVLICLHHHGAASSKDLQCQCNIRQPDVSTAISELREMNLVHFSSRSESSRGRPAHVYRLRMNLEQSIQPFVNRAKKRANDILSNVESIRALVGKVETTQDQTSMAV